MQILHLTIIIFPFALNITLAQGRVATQTFWKI